MGRSAGLVTFGLLKAPLCLPAAMLPQGLGDARPLQSPRRRQEESPRRRHRLVVHPGPPGARWAVLAQGSLLSPREVGADGAHKWADPSVHLPPAVPCPPVRRLLLLVREASRRESSWILQYALYLGMAVGARVIFKKFFLAPGWLVLACLFDRGRGRGREYQLSPGRISRKLDWKCGAAML